MENTKQRLYHEGLNNLSPLDGREILFTASLRRYLSEAALHCSRAEIQIENLIALSESGLKNFPSISLEEKKVLRGFIEGNSTFKPQYVSDYDHFGRNGVGPLEHDVKAVEVHLRELFDEKNLGHLKEFIHFPMTSEDANNLAWNMMLRGAVNNVWLPRMLDICDKLADFAKKYTNVPVLGKTHGMNASPTTFGKRFAYFLEQFVNVLSQMKILRLSGKFSGPVGNHNAMTEVAPEFGIEAYTKRFVESLGFVYSSVENQRNSHIEITRLFNEINLVNVLAADLCENIRHNVMMGWLYQEGKEGHVGSSVMPHKINPWFFEVGQGYFEKSIALIHASHMGLIPSVFERDLTDHPWERSYGEMIGYSLVGLCYVSDGLDTLRVNSEQAYAELQATPEILTEAVNIAGRLFGTEDIYMKIKIASRGRAITKESLDAIIDENITDDTVRAVLKNMQPEKYYGLASHIAQGVVGRYNAVRPSIARGFLHPMAGVEAVLFDFDNTLQTGDKEELRRRLVSISQSLCFDFSQEEVCEFATSSDYKEIRKSMVDAYKLKNPNSDITEAKFEETNDRISGTFDNELHLFDGVKDLLNKLAFDGYKIGLVTTRGKKSLTRLLAMHGIEHHFKVIITRDDAKERKPHPQPIAIALEKMGVNPRNAVYIGDNQTDDVIAGNALGVQTILVHRDKPLNPHGAVPTYNFVNIADVMRLF